MKWRFFSRDPSSFKIQVHYSGRQPFRCAVVIAVLIAAITRIGVAVAFAVVTNAINVMTIILVVSHDNSDTAGVIVAVVVDVAVDVAAFAAADSPPASAFSSLCHNKERLQLSLQQLSINFPSSEDEHPDQRPDSLGGRHSRWRVSKGVAFVGVGAVTQQNRHLEQGKDEGMD